MVFYFINLQFSVWRGGKFLIYIDLNIFRVVHGNQFDLITIDSLPKLFSHLDSIFAIFLMKQFPRDFQVFFRSVGKCISLFTTHDAQGHAQSATPHHVFHKHIFLSVPCIKKWTTAFEFLGFDQILIASRRENILRYSIRPKNADHICFFTLAKSKV